MNKKNIALAHTTATTLDLAYTQYSVQWQKIGNMQSSASGILTIISITASLMVGMIIQISDINKILKELGKFSYGFYISFIFSLLYLGIASYFVFQVIKVKNVDVLKYPEELRNIIESETSEQINECVEDTDSIALIVDMNVLLKLNTEIENVGTILKENQINYNKCLKASFLSFISSFITLGHISSHIFNNNIFYISIVGIFGYLSVFGLIYIFIGGKNE